MKIVRQLPVFADRPEGKTVGFVPTMGYLHEGHLSLIQCARRECDLVVLSIFVNPLQFGPNEDFDSYPRDEERDLALAREAGVDIVFLPTQEVMYPRPIRTKVSVSGITEKLCGASRPGHFDGVATVVAKLFHIVKPHKAYFGMKDAQQLAVIQTMVADLNMDVEIVPCPIVRHEDGLAMSSRNVRLSPEERRQATVLNRSLAEAEAGLMAGWTAERARRHMIRQVQEKPLAKIDYIEVLSYPLLEELPPSFTLSELPENGQIILAQAVWFGKTRLIDNRIIGPIRRDTHVSHDDEVENP